MRNYDILKTHCKYIFLVRSGNFWYEEDEIGDDKTIKYRACNGILYLIYVIMTLSEMVAVVMGDFPEDEKRDLVTFTVSHTIVLIKIMCVYKRKEFIKILNEKMVVLCKDYEEQRLMEEKYKVLKMNMIAYGVTVYGSVACFIFEGLRKYFAGSHFVTVVTYYPPYEDNSFLATSVRVYNTIVLSVLMITMILSVDLFTVFHLIMYKYKLITLRHYFEKLGEEIDKLIEKGNQIGAVDKLAIGLVEGIKMHKDLIRLLKDIDKAFGLVIALQVCLSSGSAVTLLLQLALSDQLTFMASMKIILFVAALFLLLAVFLCNAGEITYQASLLSDTIFYCGWHLCPVVRNGAPRQNVRRLVLLAVLQAQRPLLMKAFNMLQLTYATFLQVVRGTYSVFALFYAQNKN